MNENVFVGLDVHKDTTTIAALDEQGHLISESVVITQAQVICNALRSFGNHTQITFEVGTQSNWLYQQTKSLVKQVVVCNSRENKLLQTGNKSDSIDAKKLAELLRLNAIKPIWQHSAEELYLKQLVRGYDNLVTDSTRLMNRLKALYRGHLLATDSSVYKVDERSKWLDKLPEKGAQARAKMLYEQLDFLLERRAEAKKKMIKQAKQHRDFQRLFKIPGLGEINVCRLLVQVGEPERFKTKRQFWKYCGFAVETYSSADHRVVNGKIQKKVKQITTRGLTQHYNHRLKAVFKTAANKAKTEEPFSKYYENLLQKGVKKELARVSLARKIAAITLSIWKKQTQFDPQVVMTA